MLLKKTSNRVAYYGLKLHSNGFEYPFQPSPAQRTAIQSRTDLVPFEPQSFRSLARSRETETGHGLDSTTYATFQMGPYFDAIVKLGAAEDTFIAWYAMIRSPTIMLMGPL